MISMEKQRNWGENCHFFHHKSNFSHPELSHDLRGENVVSNRLCYGSEYLLHRLVNI
jgi:hypothetical protein